MKIQEINLEKMIITDEKNGRYKILAITSPDGYPVAGICKYLDGIAYEFYGGQIFPRKPMDEYRAKGGKWLVSSSYEWFFVDDEDLDVEW